MKKFTRLWQLLIVFALSTGVVFAQEANVTAKKLNQNSKAEQILQKKTAGSDLKIDALSNEQKFDLLGGQDLQVILPNEIKSDVPGGFSDDLFCPGSPLFAQPASGYTSAGNSDADGGYRIYQPYSGSYDITEIHYWGIHAYFDGAGWVPCTEEPLDFEIGLWNNNAGLPGTNVQTYNVNIAGVGTGEFFAGTYEIFEYSYVLPSTVTLADGWVSVQANPGGDPTCWFLWVNTGTLGTNAQQEDLVAGTFADPGYPMSLCIYGVPPACAPPTGANTTLVTQTTARANWVAGGTETLWNLEYGPAGFALGTGTLVTGITPPALGNPRYDFTGLTGATSYDWYVQADCGGGDVSNWVGANNFTTACATFPTPFNESFDVQADPVCWTNTSSNPVGNGLWEYGRQGSNPAGWGASAVDDHTGNGGFFAFSDGSVPEVADITLTGPPIDASGLVAPVLNFWVFSNNVDNPGDNVPLYVEFWDGAAWNLALTYAADNPAWVLNSIDLSGYTITGDVQFRFITDQTFTTFDAFYNDILIDDIYLGEAITCPDPFALGTNNVTATGLDLVWSSLSGVSNVEYGITGFTPGTGTTLSGVASPQTVALVNGETYDFWVQDVCGGDLSNWVGPYTFTYTYIPPPANDNCADATPIGEVVDLPFSTIDASPDTYGTCMTSNNIWYNYTATMSGDVTFSLCGSSYDTKLAVYDSFDCGTMVQLACNDDSGPDCSGLQSSIQILGVTAGDQFKIEVGGFGSGAGDGILNVFIPATMYNVTGIMTYTNGTPMDAVTINLMDGATVIGTDLTDGAGSFAFMAPDGNYTYESATSKLWGGLNVIDIIFMKLRLANQSIPVWDPIMSEIAADVNIPTGLNVVDLLMMQLRAGNLTAPAWNNDDWLFEPVPVTVAGGDLVQDVRSICGGDVNFSYVPASQIPANDECVNAEFVGGPYPYTVNASNEFATIDCAGVLDWNAVWYEVDLPFAFNDLNVDYCGSPDQSTIGIVYYPDCSDCGAYVIADTYVFYDCGTPGGVTVGEMTFNNIPGPTTVLFPVYQEPLGDFTATFDVTEYIPPTGYCVAGAANEDEFILNLTCGTIVDGPNVPDGLTYHDRTALSTDLAIGVGAPLSFDNGTPYLNDQGTVWVDWNQDEDFDDAGEQFILTDTNGDGSLYDGVIIPPVGALTGPTRMRVRINYTAVPVPCGNNTWGEVVDYTVNVTP